MSVKSAEICAMSALLNCYVARKGMAFIEIMGAIAAGRAALGVTVKDLIEHLSNTDKNLITDYFAFLEGRMVLVTPFDQEVTIAVIKSLEEIKAG